MAQDKLQIDIFDCPRDEKYNWDDIYNFLPTPQAWLVELTKAFARAGHMVTLYWDGLDFEQHGIYFRNRREYDGRSRVVIAWESPQAFPANRFETDCCIYWSNSHEKWNFSFDYDSLEILMTQSGYHVDEIQKTVAKKLAGDRELLFCSIPPGIDKDEFDVGPVKRIKSQFLYASRYQDGLKELLSYWPKIRREIREARLIVTYGSAGSARLAGIPDKAWRVPFSDGLKQPGVIEFGQVTRAEMSRLFMESDILAFPCSSEPRFSQATFKAQYAKCIPVTTNAGCLSEVNAGGVVAKPSKWCDSFLEVATSERLKKDLRQTMEEEMNFPSWDEIAGAWVEEIAKVAKVKK